MVAGQEDQCRVACDLIRSDMSSADACAKARKNMPRPKIGRICEVRGELKVRSRASFDNNARIDQWPGLRSRCLAPNAVHLTESAALDMTERYLHVGCSDFVGDVHMFVIPTSFFFVS